MIRLFYFKGLILSSINLKLCKELRKKKRKYANAIMLLLILFVLFYIVMENRNVKVIVDELIYNYSIDRQSADNNYLKKDIELTGKFKSLLQSAYGEDFIQMETLNDTMNLYCILNNPELIEKASSITSGTSVTIVGKCLGLKEDIFDPPLNSIFIEVENIK